MNSVDEQNNQLLHICKICKKVYSDRTGLMEHQRLQHPQPKISVSQQVQQLAMNMNRFNNRKNNVSIIRNYAPKGEDGGGVRILRVDQSCPTLQKPPAYLKPKLQSRTINHGGGSGGRIDDQSKNVFDYDDGDPDECKNGEVDKDDTESPTIITASMAESTAACYNPDGSSNSLGRTAAIPSTSPSPRGVGGISGNKSIPGRIQIPQLKVIGGGAGRNQKTNPNLTRFHQKLSAAAGASPPNPVGTGGNPGPGSKTVQQGIQSPTKLAGNRAPVPKLMSKTKAQFQILKSQATRPKIVPRNATNNALPKVSVTPANGSPTPAQSVVGKVPAAVNSEGGTPASTNTVLKPNKQGDLSVNEEKLSNPPKLPAKSQASQAAGNNKVTSPIKKKGAAVIVQKPEPVAKKQNMNINNTKKVAEKPAALRRESLNTPSGSGSEEDDSKSDDSSAVSSDEEEDDGPPPAKKATLGRNRSSTVKAAVTKKSPAKPAPAASSAVAKKSPAVVDKPFYPSKKYDDEGQERIFGKEYRCPAMDKVASYLNKRGVRVWICLVCEEPEEEISQGPMICCDSCEDWYHFFCVGVDEEPPEDEKWFCKRCIYKNIQKKLHTTTSPGKGKAKPAGGRGSARGKAARGGGRGRGRGGGRGRGRR